jgi:hypothetical protein
MLNVDDLPDWLSLVAYLGEYATGLLIRFVLVMGNYSSSDLSFRLLMESEHFFLFFYQNSSACDKKISVNITTWGFYAFVN